MTKKAARCEERNCHEHSAFLSPAACALTHSLSAAQYLFASLDVFAHFEHQNKNNNEK